MLFVDLRKELREAIRDGCRKGKNTRRKASVAVTRPFECLMTLINSQRRPRAAIDLDRAKLLPRLARDFFV